MKLSWKGCELTKYIQIDLVNYIDGYPEKIENKRQYKQYICYNTKTGSSFYHITKTIKLFYLRQISKIKYMKHFQTKHGIKYVQRQDNNGRLCSLRIKYSNRIGLSILMMYIFLFRITIALATEDCLRAFLNNSKVVFLFRFPGRGFQIF